ncbi:MAG: apolipoprotein N-acyltransferase [Gammaproteobacteria bacterium]|nr:apolipoprotein N-acyltransferase [Gammaproteobacteria bacterium]
MNGRLLALLGNFRIRLLLAALLGAVNVLAFAPFDLVFIPVVVLPLFFFLLEGESPRRGAWLGFAFGFAWFAVGTHWLYISLHDFGGVPVILAIFLMLGLAAIMAGYYALFGWLLNRYWPATDWRRYLLAAPALWTLIEWARGWFLSGFPWFSMGYSQVDTWLVGYAPLGGVFLVSLAVVMLAAAIRVAVSASPVLRAVAGLIVASVIFGGYLLQGVQWTEPTGETIRVALVQGNVPQDEKWLPENRIPTMEKYWRLTEEVIDEADLIIWPEAAIPALYNQVENTYFDQIESELLRPGQRLITGILTYDAERRVYHNSAVVLGGEERRFYHKRHLVPFGEYFPVPDFVREWLRLMNLPYSDFEAGEGSNALKVSDDLTVAMMICYEAVFGGEVADGADEAQLLVNISNDGWFGDSIGPKQHFQIARMRSVENGRPLLRITNTGISALVEPNGKVVNRLPGFDAVSSVAGTSPRHGGMNVSAWWAALALLLPAIFLRRKERQ